MTLIIKSRSFDQTQTANYIKRTKRLFKLFHKPQNIPYGIVDWGEPKSISLLMYATSCNLTFFN